MEKVLITGSSDGIGKQTALRLAGRGYYVILHGRNREKLLKIFYEIKQRISSNNLDFIVADLASQTQVRQMADKIIQHHSDLNVLINNAGFVFPRRQLTQEGVEMNFAVNYLSRFLLVNKLLETERLHALTRIINVSGAQHKKGKINDEDINFEKNYSFLKAISQAKLADVMFTYALARRLEGKGIHAYCLHPGGVKNNTFKNAEGVPALMKIGYKLTYPFLKTPYQGAETLVYLATADELSGVTGRYFVEKQEVKSAPQSYDEDVQEKLWELSNQLTGENFP